MKPTCSDPVNIYILCVHKFLRPARARVHSPSGGRNYCSVNLSYNSYLSCRPPTALSPSMEFSFACLPACYYHNNDDNNRKKCDSVFMPYYSLSHYQAYLPRLPRTDKLDQNFFSPQLIIAHPPHYSLYCQPSQNQHQNPE
jgi:hypothetical protein